MTAFDFVDDSVISNGTRRGRDSHPVVVEFAQALKDHPGRWAKYPAELSESGRYSTASNINRRAVNAPRPLRSGGYEAAVRDKVLYVRYKGGES